MKIVFTGGGSGGHFYPALAIAEEFQKRNPDAELLYIGHAGYVESREAPAHGIEFKSVPSRWLELYGNIFNKASEVIKASFGMLGGIIKSGVILRKFNPDVVIGTGGFVAFPVIKAAEFMGMSCYLHEQNAAPGRGNLSLAKKAKRIFTGFPNTEKTLGFPEKTVYTGNPVRSDFSDLSKEESRKRLGIGEDEFVLLTVGGSLGSETINSVAHEYAKRINGKKGYTLICGTGSPYFDDFSKRLAEEGISGENIRVHSYIDNMKDCISAVDMVVCRAGAMSIAELLVAGRPSIIIPYPNSVGEHQYHNAKSVQDAGGGVFYEEKDMNPKVICDKVEELAGNPDILAEMGNNCRKIAPINASETIYKEIMADYERD